MPLATQSSRAWGKVSTKYTTDQLLTELSQLRQMQLSNEHVAIVYTFSESHKRKETRSVWIEALRLSMFYLER